jgi:hypothetical protein
MAEQAEAPKTMLGCSAWRKILPAKRIQNPGVVFCWPCRKFQLMYPDYAGDQEHEGEYQ